MSADRLQGFVFVHGINQSQKDLEGMDRMFRVLLNRFGILDRFQHASKTYVWSAKWRSLGNFLGDLKDLYTHKVRRDEAVADVQRTIRDAWTLLAADAAASGKKPSLLVCGHSMGQVMSVAALHGLQIESMEAGKPKTFPIPTSLLTIGGPLGNDDPIVDRWLKAGKGGEEWVKTFCPKKPEAVHEWVDVFNPLDPVCHAPVLGSSEYPGSAHVVFKVPGQPPFPKPFEAPIRTYHSAYFDHPDIYKIAALMLDRL